MYKLKIGDKVKVKSGKDKGREGKIEKIFYKKGKVLIPEVNVYKKHVKSAAAKDNKGGIYDFPKPLDVSKVALVCTKCKKPTRVGIKEVSGKKVRICKKCKKQIDGRAKKS